MTQSRWWSGTIPVGRALIPTEYRRQKTHLASQPPVFWAGLHLAPAKEMHTPGPSSQLLSLGVVLRVVSDNNSRKANRQ